MHIDTPPQSADAVDLSGRTILQVIPALDAGGAERTTVEIAGAVVAAGGRALVATSGGRLAEPLRAAGGEIRLMPVHSKNPLVIAHNARRLARLVREEGVDIIHARSRAPAWSALWAARATGARFVTTYHGAYGNVGPLKDFYNSVMLRADLVIANSQFTADSIAGRLRARGGAARLAVIPRGADLDRFRPDDVAAEDIAAIGRQWGFATGGLVRETGDLVALLPARMTDWKGHGIALEAARLLVTENSRNRSAARAAGAGQRGVLWLVFVGDAQGRDAYVGELHGDIARLGLRSTAKIIGHCEDMPAAYSFADVVLAPSTRPEAFGRTAVEAGAMARPVIAADHGGARETVCDGETGFLTPPGDPVALAAAIARVWDMSPDARAAMGAAGRALATSRYSTARMRASTVAAYERLLSDPFPAGRAAPAAASAGV